jgi:hypothetical protein
VGLASGCSCLCWKSWASFQHFSTTFLVKGGVHSHQH